MYAEEQTSLGSSVAGAGQSARICAGLAAMFMLASLFVPIVSVRSSLSFGIATPVSGLALTGIFGWLLLATFVLAAAARFVPALGTYQRSLDIVAFLMLAIAVVWAVISTMSDIFTNEGGHAEPHRSSYPKPISNHLAEPKFRS